MLKDIFNSLTPDNIKNIQLIKDSIDIFLNFLETNSDISIDIRKMYKIEKTAIRDEFLQIYLDDLYNVFQKSKTSKNIQDRIDKVNSIYNSTVIQKDFIGDITKTLNSEYFLTSKEFKQKKGTKLGIQYIYNLIENLNLSTETKTNFNLTELDVFNFKVEGSVYKEMYEEMVKPLAHPLGWIYVYSQLIKEEINDLFNIEYLYDVKSTEVRCLDGYFDIFTQSYTDAAVKTEFLTRIDPATGNNYTLTYYNTYVTVYLNKTVKTLDLQPRLGKTYKSVIFTDGSYVEQFFDPINVNFKDSSGNIIKDYPIQCSLYLDYISTEIITTQDTINYENTFSISKIKENNSGNVDTSIFTRFDPQFAFAVGGTQTLYNINKEYIIGKYGNNRDYFYSTDNEYFYSTDNEYTISLYKVTGNYIGNVYVDILGKVGIYAGKEILISNTSDVYWVVDDKTISETFSIDAIHVSSYLTTTDSLYLTTTDGLYLTNV